MKKTFAWTLVAAAIAAIGFSTAYAITGHDPAAIVRSFDRSLSK